MPLNKKRYTFNFLMG